MWAVTGVGAALKKAKISQDAADTKSTSVVEAMVAMTNFLSKLGRDGCMAMSFMTLLSRMSPSRNRLAPERLRQL